VDHRSQVVEAPADNQEAAVTLAGME